MWTHFWRRPLIIDPGTFAGIAGDSRYLLHMLVLAGVELAGLYGCGSPVMDERRIALNAPYPGGWDTFVLNRVEGSDFPLRDYVWEHCTTAGGYDLTVRAVLLIARKHVGSAFHIDGAMQVNRWNEARALCQAKLGYGSEIEVV